MGSFQADGRAKSGWLAMSLCCAPGFRHDEEDDTKELRGNFDAERGLEIFYEQPQPVVIPMSSLDPVPISIQSPAPARPSTSHSTVSQWISSGREYASKTSFSTIRKSKSTRPSISAPTDFRRVDYIPKRRESFKPLHLSIHCPDGRLSPLPDFDFWSGDSGLEFPKPAHVRDRPESVNEEIGNQFKIQRKPVGSSLRSLSVDTSKVLTNYDGKEAPPIPPRSPHRPTPPNPLSFELKKDFDYTPSSVRSRSLTDPVHYLPRTSSFRRTPKNDIDEAIRELNTIVEETRRAGATYPSTSTLSSSATSPDLNSHHIPAIAPYMKVRARTETLSDIGSAFSTPLAPKPLPATPPYSPTLSSSAMDSDRLNHLYHENLSSFRFPAPSAAPDEPLPPRPSTRDRVSKWIRRTPYTSSSASVSSTPTTAQFYQCRDQALLHSANSSFSSITESHVSTPSLAFSDESPLSQKSGPPTFAATSPTGEGRPLAKSRSIHSLSSMRWMGRMRGWSSASKNEIPPTPPPILPQPSERKGEVEFVEKMNSIDDDRVPVVGVAF